MREDKRPWLIYDGDCDFCRWWIMRWSHVTRGRVRYAPYQEATADFPQIPAESFDTSVQFVDADGSVCSGAEAVFRALACAPGHDRALRLYRAMPLFAGAAENVYRFVAGHRGFLSRLTRIFIGTIFYPPEYGVTRRIFLSALALVFLLAFASLGVQISGLAGEEGILPAGEFLDAVRGQSDIGRYWFLPTIFWVNSGGFALQAACAAGAILAVLAALRIFPAAAFVCMWFLYLSLFTVGREFLAFQWDTLLLEAGFLAIFLPPWRMRPLRQNEPPASPLVIWLYRWLLFRLMFGSGLVKILSGDPHWASLTALQYHFETQPLPTWIGWYFHQLPAVWQQASTLGVILFQLLAPFLIFGGRRLRKLAFWIFVLFQLLIEVTGNYGFFNLLTIILCLPLLDDHDLPSRLRPPQTDVAAGEFSAPPEEPRFKRLFLPGASALVLVLSLIKLGGAMLPGPWLDATPVRLFLGVTQPLELVNSYGLFAVMTTERREIVIEGSDDAENWRAYRFRWKPDATERAPVFIGPHMPRLDWMMWFAALGNYRQNTWFLFFMKRLLEGSAPVLGLMEENPFPQKPPRYVRARVYDYRFTDFSGKSGGEWWRRRFAGEYSPVMQLRGE